MHWVALLLCCTAAFALPLPDEVDSDDTRKVLGSSVVTSVSVIMDLGNGTQAVYTNNASNPKEKPIAGGDVGSPVEMATPDQYQYYSIDGSGNVIKRFMTKDDLTSIIASNQKHDSDSKPDSPTFYHSMPANIGDLEFETTQDGEEPEDVKQSQLRVHNVIASVQNLLKSQMASQANVRPPIPTHISPEASASWSKILPSFFGNQAADDETFEETQINDNDTEPSTSTDSAETQDHKSPVSSSHKPISETNFEKLETIIVAASKPTINIKNVTIPLAASTTEKVQQSSESQMLGDAPAASVTSDESSSLEEDETSSATSKTEYELVQSTEPIKHSDTYYNNKKPEPAQETQSTESFEKVESTDTLPESSSPMYEIISTSNVSPTLVRNQTTAKPPQKYSQTSNNSIVDKSSHNKTSSVLLTSEQNLALENHESELQKVQPNNTLLPSEVTSEGSGSGETSDMPESNPSVDDSVMLADSPVDLTYKDNSANSDILKEKVPSETTGNQDNSLVQSSTNSAEKEESNDNIPISSTKIETVTEKISVLSDEQSQSESVEDVIKDNLQDVSTSKNKNKTNNTQEENLADSSEEDSEDSPNNANKDSEKITMSAEKLAIAEVHTTSDSNEAMDSLKDETSTDSLANVNNSIEKETTISSEEVDNSKEHASSESMEANSEENTESAEKLQSVEDPSQSVEDNVSSASDEQILSALPDKLKAPIEKVHPESVSVEDNVSSASDEQISSALPDKLKAPVEKVHPESVSVEDNVSSASDEQIASALPDKLKAPVEKVHPESVSLEDIVLSASDEKILSALPDKLKAPVEKVHPESVLSTSNLFTLSKPSEKIKIDSLQEQVQADSPYVDKLGEQSSSDLANTAVISEENHSSFNQVDLSTSSSKETIASKYKNGSNSEKVQSSDIPSAITKIAEANSTKVIESITVSKTNTSFKLPINSDSLSSNETLEVSESPAETTDTSSSTPEVTEYSGSSEERIPEKVQGVLVTSHGQVSSEESSEAATTQTSSTSMDDEFHITHNLDESVASIVSQITNSNIDPQISIDNSKVSIGMDTDEKSGISSSAQDSTPEIQENSATEIVVTSVSTSKSTQSSSASVESSSEETSNEEGSGLSNVCGLDASCSNEDILVNSNESPLESDRISAGSESVEISTTFVSRNKTDGTRNESTIENSNNRIVQKVDLVTGTSQTSDETLVTENPLSQTNSTLLEGEVLGILTTMLTERINANIDSATPSSVSLTESGDIIPISGEGDSSNENNKINESIKLTPPKTNVKLCNKEGSGSDSLAHSCEDIFSGSGSGSGSIERFDSTEDSIFEGSGDTTILGNIGNSMNASKASNGSTDGISNEELDDIMKYASSKKDIGITTAPKYDTSNEDESNELITSSEDLLESHQTDKQNDSSASTAFVDSNEFVTQASVPSDDKPSDGHVMDLFAYMNSDVDIGITNAYTSSDSETTEEPSSMVSNETSSEELLNNPHMDLFKYANSDADIGITSGYTDSEAETTEESASTDSNEIESTTVFDMDTMVNDQPYSDKNDDGIVDSVFPDHGNFVKDWISHSTADKEQLNTDHRQGTLPQKAQKDDSINNYKYKPQMIASGAFEVNLEKEAQKSKRRNNTQPEDKNWTKVEVISHLANTTPTVQQTSTMKPSHETVHATNHNVPKPPPSGTRPQFYSPSSVELDPAPQESLGLEASTAHLVEDVQQFADLCNELAFKLWVSMTDKSVTASRSLVMSPFAVTSLLAMIFLGAKGATSGQMNDMLKLDDMMTFNPHQVFKNVTESVVTMQNPGVRTAAFVRELYSDKGKGPLLDFYKQRASQFYDGLVEEADFSNIGDILRRRTNLQIKKQTGGRVPEYLRGNSLLLQPPLAAFSANIFQTECRGASTHGRDGEMYFTILPTTRQRRLVPIPSVVFRTGFLAGYEPGLDATVVSLGTQDSAISTLFVLPGQQGQTAPGDGLSRLEARLLASAYTNRAWSRLLRSLLVRPGMEVQIPRFSHRSQLNVTHSLQRMGLNELFNPVTADLKGLSGVSTAIHVSDLVQVNTFTTCGEEVIGSRHHVEIYPSAPQRAGRDTHGDEQDLDNVPLVSRPRQARLDLSLEPSGFEEAVPQASILNMPLALRPRQARLPDGEESLPRLKFDRPFLYFVRHNPTGFILHMGRFNPRLIQ